MDEFNREISREIRVRKHAEVVGALVRPPRNGEELAKDEQANAAEIDRLEERRGNLWRHLSEAASDSYRLTLSYDLDACARSLDLAFAERRRLRVARELYSQGIFA